MAITSLLRAAGQALGALLVIALTPLGARLGGVVTDRVLRRYVS